MGEFASRPDANTTLEFWPWVTVAFRCHYCAWSRLVKTVLAAEKLGATTPVDLLLNRFVSGCRWNPANPAWKPQKYGHKCGAYCPDIGRTKPPDLPPSLSGLKVVEGGKASQLPAEPAPRRRRVGQTGDE